MDPKPQRVYPELRSSFLNPEAQAPGTPAATPMRPTCFRASRLFPKALAHLVHAQAPDLLQQLEVLREEAAVAQLR